MSLRPESEFRNVATPSQEMLRKLLTMAIYGNESLYTVFAAMADRAGLTERGREARQRQEERYAALRQMTMASQERIAEFHRRLERLERETYEAMIEAEEKLREARKELDELRERAYEIVMPDGRKTKVYRDGDKVIEEDGTLVDPDIIGAEDVPENFPTGDQLRSMRSRVEIVEKDYKKKVSDFASVGEARERLGNGEIGAEELQELEESIEPIEHRLEDRTGASPDRAVRQQPQAASTPGPE